MVYVIFCACIVSRGSEESNLFNYVFTVFKIFTLLFIMIMSFTYFDLANFEPFFLEERGGFSGTVYGAMIIFFAYVGFDFITCLAEEA